MREHQKYFPVVDSEGALLPFFVAVNNTDVKNKAMAANGHERVLRARLEDGLFFFNKDKEKPLADRMKDLSGIIFQRKLGTMAEKSERLVALASFLAERLAPEMQEDAKRAAQLAKADLLTEMVGEFPSSRELSVGIMPCWMEKSLRLPMLCMSITSRFGQEDNCLPLYSVLWWGWLIEWIQWLDVLPLMSARPVIRMPLGNGDWPWELSLFFAIIICIFP